MHGGRGRLPIEHTTTNQKRDSRWWRVWMGGLANGTRGGSLLSKVQVGGRWWLKRRWAECGGWRGGERLRPRILTMTTRTTRKTTMRSTVGGDLTLTTNCVVGFIPGRERGGWFRRRQQDNNNENYDTGNCKIWSHCRRQQQRELQQQQQQLELRREWDRSRIRRRKKETQETEIQFFSFFLSLLLSLTKSLLEI